MPAAIPLALSAGGAIYGAIKNSRDKKKAEEQQAAQAAQAAASGGGGGGGGGGHSTPNAAAMAGFGQFAQTGGFSPEDLANIRARAVSPVRATYANAQREVNRQRAIQGGYSPGFGVLQARMAREQGQGISDAAEGAEADIAKMVQSGKLAGLQGLAQYGQGYEGGGGGGEGAPAATATAPEQKKGFWGKVGGALGKVGQVALPIALDMYGNGPKGKITTPGMPKATGANNFANLPGFGTPLG
jgi:hypothetical protein